MPPTGAALGDLADERMNRIDSFDARYGARQAMRSGLRDGKGDNGFHDYANFRRHFASLSTLSGEVPDALSAEI